MKEEGQRPLNVEDLCIYRIISTLWQNISSGGRDRDKRCNGNKMKGMKGMKNRKLQRILSFILTLTMIFGASGKAVIPIRAAESVKAEETVTGYLEEPDIDQSCDDTTVQVTALTHDRFGVFEVRGDNSGKYEFDKPLISENGEPVENTGFLEQLDSTRGLTLFIVPLAGYEIRDDEAAEAIKVSGAYAENDDDYGPDNWETIGDEDYTIARAAKNLVTDNVNYDHEKWYEEYDFSEAWTVTLAGNSSWLEGYKLAEYHDTNPAYYGNLSDEEKASDSRIALPLTVTIDEKSISGKDIPVTVTGAKKTVDISYDYSAAATGVPIDFEDAVYNWDGYNAAVSLVGMEDGRNDEITISQTDTDPMLSNELKCRIILNDNENNIYGKAYLSPAAVRAAYLYGMKGYVLTVTLINKDDRAVYVKSASPLVEFIQYSPAAGSALRIEGNAAAAEPDVWRDKASEIMIPVCVKPVDDDGPETDPKRLIGDESVYYQIGENGTRKQMSAIDDSTSLFVTVTPEEGVTTVGDDWVIYNDQTDSFDDTVNGSAIEEGVTYYVQSTTGKQASYGKWYYIPAVDAASAGGIDKTIILSADTLETVEFTVNSEFGDKLYAKVILDDTDGTVITAGKEGSDCPIPVTVATGKDLRFRVIPVENRRIESVNAKMYAVNGSGGEDIEVTKDDFGFYTIPAVTGWVDVSITAGEASHDRRNVCLESKEYYVLSGDKLTTGPQVYETGTFGMITTAKKDLAYNGEDFFFMVKPSVDRMVKSVSYSMGNDTENKISLTAQKTFPDGTCCYVIPAVTGNLVIDIEEVDAVRVQKLANADATITINGEEMKDCVEDGSRFVLVPADKDLTFKAYGKNGAEVDAVYFKYDDDAKKIKDTASAGQKLTVADDGSYTIKKSDLTVHTDADLFISVYTVRPDDKGYEVKLYKDSDCKEEYDLTGGIILWAGGDVATGSKTDNTAEVYSGIVDDNGKNVKLSKNGVKHEWTITDEDLLSLDPDGSEGHPFTHGIKAVSKQKAGSDTLTYTVRSGFPDAVSYCTELPVEVKPLSAKYDLSLLYKATKSGADQTLISTKNLENSKMIRLDNSVSGIRDKMMLSVQDKTKAVIGDGLSCGDDKSIRSVTWSVAKPYETSLINKPYLVNYGVNFDNIVSPFLDISAPKEARTLTITALVIFADGTDKDITGTLELSDITDGYTALAFTDNESYTPPSEETKIHLETTTGGRNSADIRFRVTDGASFKLLNDEKTYDDLTEEQKELFDGAKDSDDLETMLNLYVRWGIIKEITDFSMGEPTFDDNEDSISVSGTNPLTITAKKRQINESPAMIEPDIRVGGVQATAGKILVSVCEDLPGRNVKVKTEDKESKLRDYRYPLMTGGLAADHAISRIATPETKGSQEELYTGLFITDVKNGTLLTLPDQSAFDTTTVDPKRQLVGWKVTLDAVHGDYGYYRPGRMIRILDDQSVIEAIWAYTYKDNSVSLYSEIFADGSEQAGYSDLAIYEEGVPTGVGELNIALGASIQAKIGYRKLNAPEMIDVLNDKGGEGADGYDDPVYTADGLTFTKKSDNGICDAPADGVFTAKEVNETKEEIFEVAWKHGNNVFSTFDTNGATDRNLCATLKIKAVPVTDYQVTINGNNTVADLRVGRFMALPLEIKTGSGDKTITDPGDLADYRFAVVDDSVAGVRDTGKLTSFVITGKKTGSTTLTFDAVDKNGNTMHQEAVVIVSNSDTDIELTIKNDEDNKAGETIAENAELNAIAGQASRIGLSLRKDDNAASAASWEIRIQPFEGMNRSLSVNTLAVKNTDTDYYADIPASISFGMNKFTVICVDEVAGEDDCVPAGEPLVWYEREMTLRSYVVLAVAGPTAEEAEAGFTVSRGGDAIDTGKFSYVRIPYARKGGWGHGDCTASLKNFSAAYNGRVDVGMATAFIGWDLNKDKIQLDHSTADIMAEGDFVSAVYDENTQTYSNVVPFPEDGVIPLRAVFGQKKIELSGLPRFIELEDAVLSTGGADKDSGSDRYYVSVEVKPHTSARVFKLTGSDKNKFILKGNSDYYPESKGYSRDDANLFWNHTDGADDAVVIRANDGEIITDKRTDHFTVAKVYDPDRSSTYVGTGTIYVWTNGDESTPYAEITVYLNGEYADEASSSIRYMYRGEILQNGERTVNGEIHYYRDGVKVENGAVTLEGGHLILVKDGTQWTEAGYTECGDNAYYVDRNGFLKASGKFNGEQNNDMLFTFCAKEDGTLVRDDFISIEDKLYYFNADACLVTGSGDSFTAISCANNGKQHGTFDYVIDEDGVIMTARLITIEGKNYYLNSYGQKVTCRMCDNGRYTDPVTGDAFIIYEDDTAVSVDGNNNIAGRLVPISADGSIAISGLRESYLFTGKAIKPNFAIIDTAHDTVLAKGVDYTVKFKNNKKIDAVADVIITGRGNYRGKNKKAHFRIKDPLTEAGVDPDSLVEGVKSIAPISGKFTYNGEPQYPDTLRVTLTDNSVVNLKHTQDGRYVTDGNGKNVVISVCNNTDKGKAVIAAVGKDRKVRTGSFRIAAAQMSKAEFAKDIKATYSVKGATPDDLKVYLNNGKNNVELIEGQDFKAVYKNNRSAGTGEIILTGRGNFKGKLPGGTFAIGKLAPAKINAVGLYDGAAVGNVKVLVMDDRGFALDRNKQLDVKYYDENGGEIAPATKIKAGQKVTVAVKSRDDNVSISENGLTSVIKVGQNIGKAAINSRNLSVTYTGGPVELDAAAVAGLQVTCGNTALKYGEDYEIVGYNINAKKRTMTVTIRGTGEDRGRGVFSGFKAFTVKIKQRDVE